jgi:hypothetical protein
MTCWTPALRSLPRALRPNEGMTPRADHARMLAHAAVRRLRALGQDGGYWKACAPMALRRAAALRRDRGFSRLP